MVDQRRHWWHRDPAEAELADHLGRRVSVLARGRSDNGDVVLGLIDGFAVRQSGRWQFIDWHLVRNGGWDETGSALTWHLADETSGQVTLTEPGRVPEFFNERVKATIVIEDRSDAPGGGQVVLVGRRPLGTSAPGQRMALVWQAVAVGRASLTDPRVRDHVLDRVDALRIDYDL